MRGGETGMLVRRKLPLFCCSIQSSLSLRIVRQRNNALHGEARFTKPLGEETIRCCSLTERGSALWRSFSIGFHTGTLTPAAAGWKGNVWRKRRRKERDGFFLELFTSPEATFYRYALNLLQETSLVNLINFFELVPYAYPIFDYNLPHESHTSVKPSAWISLLPLFPLRAVSSPLHASLASPAMHAERAGRGSNRPHPPTAAFK